MDNSPYIRPPGTFYETLPAVRDGRDTVEVAIVQDHRFAFFYWQKWKTLKKEGFRPPVLVSLDWHQDLAGPDDEEKDELRNLDPEDYLSVGRFCWEKLNQLNDGHILAAAFLNLIGDIHILHKQEDDSGPNFKGLSGENHEIVCYKTAEALVAGLTRREGYDDAYFDIDLDYFTESPDSCGGGKEVVLVDDGEIAAVLSPDGALMKWVLHRLAGMTIATEPEFCGGMVNSNRIFNIVDETLFTGRLVSGACGWRHLAT